MGDDWSDEANPDARLAGALKLRPIENGLGTTVIDAAETPWPGLVLGTRLLDRAEALADPRIRDVFHVVDHIAEQDPVVSAHFSVNPGQ